MVRGVAFPPIQVPEALQAMSSSLSHAVFPFTYSTGGAGLPLGPAALCTPALCCGQARGKRRTSV